MELNYKNISGLLNTKLSAITDGASPTPHTVIHEVHEYGESSFGGYPACVIIKKTGTGEMIDTKRIQRTWMFDVILYQEQSAVGKSQSEADEAMTDVVDRVTKSFDQDPDLNGQVMRVLIVGVELDYTVRSGTFNFAKFSIRVEGIVPNYT